MPVTLSLINRDAAPPRSELEIAVIPGKAMVRDARLH